MDMGADLPDGLKSSHRCWLEAVEQADLDGYVDLVVEDVVWIRPGQEALQGRVAFRRWVGPFFEQYTYGMSVRDADIRVAGRWAVEKGTFHSRVTPRAGGDTMEHTGRFIALWKHAVDGKWRIDRYIDDTPEIG